MWGCKAHRGDRPGFCLLTFTVFGDTNGDGRGQSGGGGSSGHLDSADNFKKAAEKQMKGNEAFNWRSY